MGGGEFKKRMLRPWKLTLDLVEAVMQMTATSRLVSCELRSAADFELSESGERVTYYFHT